MTEPRLGISGRIARFFLGSELTPLVVIAGLLLGLFAVLVTPREEEPQIDVTFANVFVPFPGALARDVHDLIATPAAQVLSGIEGVKNVFSLSRPGMAVLTVEFEVGESRTEAIVRLYNQVFSNQDWLPPGLGAGPPLVKPMGIDDVPVIALTLWTDDPERGSHDLARIAHDLETDLKRLPGTRDIRTIGGAEQVVHVLLDPQRLAGHGLALDDLRMALRAASASREAGAVVADDREILVHAGGFLSDAGEVANLVVAVRDGLPVYLTDVAEVRHGPAHADSYVLFGAGPAAVSRGIGGEGLFPAVTLTVSKKPGVNAVTLAGQAAERIERLKEVRIPEGVNVTVTRDYGKTADDKARTLIKKLVFATGAVVLLVWLALGWREALIVGTAVVVTLAITLFASWAWGFTLNRVSLFALIFSIGILVDDAIVVVENIHRHMQIGGRSFAEAIPVAVDEVGGPTILATFTVIAALLPMAFVSGLMGPYMSPIPINASMGMLISLGIAFVVTPWMTYRLLRRSAEGGHAPAAGHGGKDLEPVFTRLVGPFLGAEGGRRRIMLGVAVLLLILSSVSLAAFQAVVLKMLPFDNKSEFQVVLDMPEGASLERTARVLTEMGQYLATVPEVTDYQIHVGTAAPINFNGLVRQYYLREGSVLGDIQVNLVDRRERDRKSHEIALAVRGPITAIAGRYGADVKVVEMPPGPPVMAPIVAEIYGPDHAGQIGVARQVRALFESTPDIIDIDDSIVAAAPKYRIVVDRTRAAQLGVSQESVVAAVTAALGGEDAAWLSTAGAKYVVPVRLEFEIADKAGLRQLLSMPLRTATGGLVQLGEVVEVLESDREQVIYAKNLLPVVYVVGDMAGRLDSPLYGMFSMFLDLRESPVAFGEPLRQFLTAQPEDPYFYSLKWDGEWQITFETFRDMGLAYAVGLVFIYLLVVAQFRSYVVPLIIMAPIPLTVIGVMPGHALLSMIGMDAKFTATSMIGMIALAGIIVRNSILLVDFIDEERARGVEPKQAVIRAGAVRARPIVLTGLAAMIGAFFILDDPIFNGLAISLIFGILVSTLLTLLVIPVLYYVWLCRGADDA